MTALTGVLTFTWNKVTRCSGFDCCTKHYMGRVNIFLEVLHISFDRNQFKNRHFLKNAWSAHLHESGLCQNRLLVRWWRRWLTWVCVCACVCVMTVAVTVISHCVCGSQLLFGVAIGDCTGSCFSLRCWRRVTSWWLRCERSLSLLLLLLMLWNWNIATSYSPRNCFSTVLGRAWEAACCVVSWLTQWFTFKCDSQSLYFKRC